MAASSPPGVGATPRVGGRGQRAGLTFWDALDRTRQSLLGWPAWRKWLRPVRCPASSSPPLSRVTCSTSNRSDFADPLIARAASRLVLVSRGVDPDALTVPDEGMLRLGDDRLPRVSPTTGRESRRRWRRG